MSSGAVEIDRQIFVRTGQTNPGSYPAGAVVVFTGTGTSGMPALDSGRREPRLGPRVVIDDRRQRATWREPEVDRDAVPQGIQQRLLEHAARKRARRAARAW